MNRLEHLLDIAAEECAEIAIRCSKAQRFGLFERQIDSRSQVTREAFSTAGPEASLTNHERIRQEYIDLYAVLLMIDRKLVDGFTKEVEAKQAKVEHYLEYCRTIGTLTEDR